MKKEETISPATHYSEELLLGILNTSLSGLQVFRSIYNDRNEIIDFDWILVNDAMLETWGKKREELEGHTMLSLFPGVKKEGIFEVYVRAAEGETIQFRQYYNHEGMDHWFNIKAIPFRDGLILSVDDITAQVKAEDGLKRTNAVLEEKVKQRTVEIEKQRDYIYSVLMQAPAMIAILRGPEFVFELANPLYLQVIGKTSDIVGKPLLEVLPELKGQEILNIFKNVYTTGERFLGNEVQVSLDTQNDGIPEDLFFNFVYEPFRTPEGFIDGILAHAVDVTEQVHYRKKVEQNEMRLQLAQRAGHIGTFEWDLETNHIDFTSQVEIIFGFEPGAWKGNYSNAMALVHPDERERILKENEEAVVQGKNLNITHRIIRRDGSIRWLNSMAEPIFDDKGKPVKMIGVILDITDQKVREQELRESEERFHNLADTAPMFMAMADETGSAVYFNKPWLEWTGRTMDEMRGMGWLCTLHPDDAPKFERDFKNAFEKQIAIQEEYRFRRADGEYRWMLAVGAPRLTPDGRFVGYFGTYTDFHDLKQAQQETKQLMQKKDEFMAIASHELKTPITTVKASLQLLERLTEERTDAAVQSFITKASKQVDKLNQLVSDLLDVTKIHAGKMQLIAQPFELSEVIDDCIVFGKAQASHNVVVKGKIDIRLKADKHRLEQVMCNLLSNALKYSPGADKVVIEITEQADDLTIAVTDFGIGIEQEKLPYVFDRFFRVSESSMRFAGLGMGLYITREIIERHGGELSVSSEVGKGSTFQFTIPKDASEHLASGGGAKQDAMA